MTISVSCKDTVLFKQTYGERLPVIHTYPSAGIYTVIASHDFIVQVLARDTNVLFIDIVGKALPEAGTEFVNHAFNRINKAHAAFPSLTGQSVTVSVKELRFDTGTSTFLIAGSQRTLRQRLPRSMLPPWQRSSAAAVTRHPQPGA